MPSPSVNFMQIFSVFAVAFTTPAFAKAVVLACGTILTPGPRTISAALRAVGLKDENKFGKYHRLLNRDKWDSLLLSPLDFGFWILDFAEGVQSWICDFGFRISDCGLRIL